MSIENSFKNTCEYLAFGSDYLTPTLLINIGIPFEVIVTLPIYQEYLKQGKTLGLTDDNINQVMKTRCGVLQNHNNHPPEGEIC